jgi:hypothetical protein
MEPIGCPLTSVRNFHFSPRNKPEERSSQRLHGGNLKSRRSFVKDTTVPFTHNIPRIQTEKSMKYDNLTPEIKNIWKFNYISI